MMNRYIIGFGFGRSAGMCTIEAPSLGAAKAEATRRTRAKGWGDDPEDFEETFAEAFTLERAYDLGLDLVD